MVAPLKALFYCTSMRAITALLLVAAPGARRASPACPGTINSMTLDRDRSYLQRAPEKIVATLGRHPNDLMTSYYMRTPSNIYVECGWGGEKSTSGVQRRRWRLATVTSYWGHKGLFEDIGAPPSASPEVGTRRAPVQVMEGNYERMTGVCPWWDATRAKNRPFNCGSAAQRQNSASCMARSSVRASLGDHRCPLRH